MDKHLLSEDRMIMSEENRDIDGGGSSAVKEYDRIIILLASLNSWFMTVMDSLDTYENREGNKKGFFETIKYLIP